MPILGTSASQNTKSFLFSPTAYLAGGYIDGYISTIRKLNMDNDIYSTSATSMDIQVSDGGGMTNSGTAGYMTGGYQPSISSRIDSIRKILYASDSLSTLGATLQGWTSSGWTGENPFTAGYQNVGFAAGDGYGPKWTNKVTFSTDTRSNLANTSSVKRIVVQRGMQNASTAGYLPGGSNFLNAEYNSIEKISYSAETFSTLGATLTTNVYNVANVSNYGIAGYAAGGNNNDYNRKYIDKITFSNDTKSTIAAQLVGGRQAIMGLSNKNTTGFFAGGTNGGAGGGESPGGIITEKFTFSNETISNLGTTFSGQYTGAYYFENTGV